MALLPPLMQDQGYAMFMSLDGSGKGRLEPYEVLEFARNTRLQLSSQQLRYLVFHITE